jgi:hypothetical protein
MRPPWGDLAPPGASRSPKGRTAVDDVPKRPSAAAMKRALNTLIDSAAGYETGRRYWKTRELIVSPLARRVIARDCVSATRAAIAPHARIDRPVDKRPAPHPLPLPRLQPETDERVG